MSLFKDHLTLAGTLQQKPETQSLTFRKVARGPSCSILRIQSVGLQLVPKELPSLTPLSLPEAPSCVSMLCHGLCNGLAQG